MTLLKKVGLFDKVGLFKKVGLFIGRGLLVRKLGPELITNGDFDTDSDWVKGPGWTISGGKANANTTATGDNINQNAMTVGKLYLGTYVVSNYISGSIVALFGGISGEDKGTVNSSNGTFQDIRVATSPTFFLRGDPGFVGSIDNVSIKEIL